MTREEAKQWLEALKSAYALPIETYEALDMAIEALSADAVHGEWIWKTDIPIGDGRTSAGYICSNCGKDYWHGNVFDYCPSCGARMKGGEDE
jgi:rubrerythrin